MYRTANCSCTVHLFYVVINTSNMERINKRAALVLLMFEQQFNQIKQMVEQKELDVYPPLFSYIEKIATGENVTAEQGNFSYNFEEEVKWEDYIKNEKEKCRFQIPSNVPFQYRDYQEQRFYMSIQYFLFELDEDSDEDKNRKEFIVDSLHMLTFYF